MTAKQQHNPLQRREILPRPGDLVKSRIVGAGVKLGHLAAEAKISQPTLSKYISGGVSVPETQMVIWQAFCRMTRSEMTLADFWGALLSPRIAS